MSAFRSLGWQVLPYVYGDRVPVAWIRGSEQQMQSSLVKRLGSDLVRLLLRPVHQRLAWRSLGGMVDWVYERFALFQAVGLPFRRHGVPWLLEVNAPHSFVSRFEKRSLLIPLASRLEMQAFRECDIMVVGSKLLKEILVDNYRLDPRKLIVVPMAVDTHIFDPQSAQARRVFEGPTIGYVGGLNSWQALDLLLRTAHDLAQEGVCWKILIVGDGPMRTELQALAESLGMREQVCFAGAVNPDEVPAWIAGVDLGYSGQLAPEVGEIYLSPLKLYEYLAMGKPVIASEFEDSLALVKSRPWGYCFRPGDQLSLAEALHAWRSRDLGAKRQTARRLIVPEHSWDVRL
jgi:glycosyltransferase involved in cell wall biosynthesis